MTASPTRAPQERLNKNFMIISKQAMLQHLLATTSRIAAINPRLDIPMPAKTPKPQICA
jgi:hypothetical protein